MQTFPDPPADELFDRAKSGDAGAADTLFGVLYKDLRTTAQRLMRDQKKAHSLQVTALVHEAVLKLLQGERERWPESRQQLLYVASRAMRQVLIDHARARARDKRSPPGQRLLIDDVLDEIAQSAVDVVALGEALDRLEERDPNLAHFVTLRYFVGLSTEQAAEQVGMSTRTAEREWRAARAWLRRQLS